MPTKGCNLEDVLDALQSKLAYLPGGRDREGRPLVVVHVPSELQPTTKPRLESLILYFLSIFSEETKKNGLIVIVDARHGTWRVARSCIRLTTMLLGNLATSVFVVRPDAFWDKRVDGCTKSHKDDEPIYLTLAGLHAHIDSSQLPYELCGNRMYDHEQWIQKRKEIEEYTKNSLDLMSRMSDLHRRLSECDGLRIRESENDLEAYWKICSDLTSAVQRILHAGRSLINSLSRDTSKDILDSVKQIHKLLDSIELKQVDIENRWSEMERNMDTVRVIDDLEKAVSQVTDWILGPADAMLNSCCQVGFDVMSSEELRRKHEKLEMECRETYGRYAELLHKIDALSSTSLPEDLKSQRDFMDFVCRSFASRLERRRNILITSQRFFRLVSEYFDRTSDVFDKLVMGNKTEDFSRATAKLHTLEEKQRALETLEEELVKEGEKLSDILSMPVKDALGRDVRVDYGEDIGNVRDILDATNARKNIFNDSVELQKLTLKQIALIHTYETDAQQAVKWLDDLFDVLSKSHMEIGCNSSEIQSQKEKHQAFQETAKGTYDYGCQLVNGARVLRLSCRLTLKKNAQVFSRLRQAWRRLHIAGQEQLTRLRVCAVFHRSVENHCSKLRELIELVGSLRRPKKGIEQISQARIRAQIRDILADRENLLLDVGRMVRLGRLLRTRLKEPVCHQRMSEAEEDASGKAVNLSAVEAISARLAEVTRLAEKLDAKLCEAGARTRPAPISAASSDWAKCALARAKEAEVETPAPAVAPTSVESTAMDDDARLQKEEGDKSRGEANNSNGAVAEADIEEPVEDVTGDSYVTATECSVTPTARSRSESFVTTPECEDFPVLPLTPELVSHSIEKTDASSTAPVKSISLEETIEERAGKVVKEVVETTTLRVSHDTHLGLASYKVISNTLQDHQHNLDVKELHDTFRVITSDSNENIINGDVAKFESMRHEDSGIEMSPTKREEEDENREGEKFLENARKSGKWLRLKVLEVQPELTKLGASVEEATELSAAHNEVLLRLQGKQSPVEELLRQADQLISTQKPRAEVYAAMAETLGQAWRDVNDLLERRKQILDSNVLFQCRAEECGERMKALEMACNDTLLPIEIDAVKNFLSKIHDLRKAMLEALMGALQEGKTLLDKLKEIASEGTLDSRPDRIKVEADHAVLTVERWLEDLHDRRRVIEASFRNRKTQLEQCLALALLATDLRDLEEILNDRIVALSNSCDQLGDSASSAQLLLFELKKLQTEAKEFQDRSIKITKSTERLVSSGHFAGEQATEQAYAILGAAADYVNDLEQYETLLNRAVAFFEAARSAVTKLDQLEIQLATTEHPPFSARLAHFHAQTAATIEDVTEKPLAEGYTLLNITGRGVPGAEGVRRTVEDLENHKIRLMKRCTAHEEESLQISQAISVFLEKHEQLRSWLVNIAEAFLQGHQDMGSDLPMAEDFYRLHDQLLNDLDERTSELEHLEFEILPIRERLDELQRREFQGKILKLQESWTKTRSIVARRLELGSLYLKFHHVVEELKNGIELLENELKSHTDESRVEYLKEKWKNLQTLYLKLSESGKTFLDEAERMDDPYLDVPRACLCVQTILESLSNRQLTITESWEKWQTIIEIVRERRIERQRKLEESTRTLEWVSKFSEQLYPIITAQSLQLSSLLYELEAAKHRILPELKKAVDELAIRLKNIRSNTVERDEISLDEEVSRKLTQMHEKLHNTARDYEDLLVSLTSIFQKLEEIERKITDTKIRVDHLTSSTKSSDVNTIANEWESSRRAITDSLEHLQFEIERTISKIKRQESPDAASSDIEKLTSVVNKTTSLFQSFASETMTRIDEQKKICVFGEDLAKIDSDIQDLNQQLLGVDAKFHENLQAAKAAYAAFDRFEKTITILEERIEKFVRNTEISICITSAPYVKSDLASLNGRLEDLKVRMDETKKRLALCIEYFELLEEAKEWNREGGKLLIILARKTTAVKTPIDATSLLEEIEVYLRPGEQKQERRIEKLKELSTIVFGTDRLPQFNELIVENRQTLDSFAVVSSELRSLAQNLLNAEDLREKLRLEKLEADEKLHAVKREMVAAEVAREEAENARRTAEKLAAETLERASVEAERLKKESLEKMRLQEKIETQSLLSSPTPVVHEEKSERIENIDKRFIHETITSAVTKKEIQILQKVEVEKIVPIVQKEQSPVKETVTTTNASQQTEQQDTVVAQSPEFTVPLNDAIVQEGEKFSFECRLIGYPVPEVVWYKDGISILNNPDYLTVFHQGTCTLTIEETFTEDSARFTCKAFNYLGSAETSALLTVKETAPEEQASPPIFVKELQPSTAIEASSHRLECTVKGNPLPTVQWYKNEINIDNSPDYVITYNNGEACVIFEQVFFDDQATYTCKATNRLGQASTSAFLRVEPTESSTEKPYFVTPLSNAMARTGQRVKLECEAAGTPIPRLVWLHDGKIVEETSHLKIQTDDGRTSLIISEAFPKDAGCYTVTATNEVAEASVSCNVSVKGRLPHESDSELACSDIEPSEPKIQLPLKDLEVIEGSTARLDCVIVGQPEPEVIWYRNDKPVKESADFQLLFQGDKCSLLIHEAFLDDAGLYKVVAINSGGEASSQCTLTVQPALIQLPKQEDEMKQQVVEPATVPTGSPPKFIKLPTDSLVAEGEDAVFECIVTGEPKPEIKWYSDSGEIKENERILIKQKEDGTGVLKFVSAVPKDKGNYVVKAVNSCGEAKAFARLVVRSLSDFHRKEEFVQMEEKLIAPIFKERFSDKRVVEGAPIKFECIVAGKPAPKIQWLFNDRPVHGKDFLVSVSGDRQVLTIPETSRSHVGAISCLAENAAGKAHCTAKVEIDIEAAGVEGTEEGTTVEIARLLPEQDEMHASSSSEKHFSTEKTSEGDGASQILTKMSSTVTESSTTHTSTKKEYISSTTSSTLAKSGEEPLTISMKTTIHSTEKSASENGAPPVVQSEKVEEYEKIVQDRPGEIRQEKTVVVSQGEDGIKRDVRSGQAQKLCRKSTAPRFVSPLTGMIVDQGADVILEGIVDGYPQPSISWTKNGQEIPARDGATTSYAHNRVCLELKGVNVRNAGRYTCTATNDVGSASSTADLVVKKTIFPPVFGKRLQAQVVKRGDRVIMEVEITGTPEPTVTWYKDDVPIREQPPELRLKQLGNCYTLIIEKASKEHAGKYMVRATNAGGEAQSIADFAVFEPTPDTMTEVHKTVIYENVHDKRIVQSEEKMGEASGSDVKKEKAVKTTMQQPSFKAVSVPSSSSLTTRTALDTAAESEMKSCRSETISSTIESHKSETKSEQKFHMKLEHKTPPILEMEPRIVQTAARKEFLREEVTLKNDEPKMATTIDERSSENENIETSTIARKDALSFFESFSKGSESAPKGPKEMIKLVEDTADGGKSTREVKVEELTKNYERSSAFQEVKTKVEAKPTEYQATKKSVQDIFSKFQQGSSSRGVDNKLFEFPCEEYRSPLLKSGGTILEESSLSTFSKERTQFESTESTTGVFDLVPEPPPEIGYMPKPEQPKKKYPDVTLKAKQLQESFDKGLSPIDAPAGAVKIFPSPLPSPAAKPVEPPKFQAPKRPTSIPPPPFELETKKEEKSEFRSLSPSRFYSSSSDVETRSHISTDISEYRCHSAASSHQETLRSTSPRPSADGLAMEKSWAKKCPDSSRKSWPPQTESTIPTMRKEWHIPAEEYQSSTKEVRHETKREPGGTLKTTSIESSSNIEKRSSEGFTKEEIREKVTTRAPTPPKAPIIYNAETIKVDHTVNTIQEKSTYEKYIAECDVRKTESSEKTVEELSRKWSSVPGPDLKAPALVKSIDIPSKPVEPTPVTPVLLEPGPPPEIGYVPPIVKEKERRKIEHIEKTLEMSLESQPAKIPPGAVRTIPPPLSQKKEETAKPPPPPQPPQPPQLPQSTPSFEKLEPFPFEPPLSTPKPPSSVKLPPPPMPSKFVAKGPFESDYESDFDSHLKPKWRPYESDNDEPRYRRVKPPVATQPSRPKSTEPEPLPPSKFDIPPPEFTCTKVPGPRTPPVLPKVGSPPVYVQPSAKNQPIKSPTTKKPDSPKFKVKTFQQESGYMADTDEPLQQSSSAIIQKSFGKHESSSHSESRSSSYVESKSEYFERKSYENRTVSAGAPYASVSSSPKPIAPQQRTDIDKNQSMKETVYTTTDRYSQRKMETGRKIQPPPSPSKFVRSEFRESDYESDYDGRIPTLWKPRTSEMEERTFGPVKPSFASSGQTKKAMETRNIEKEQTLITPPPPPTPPTSKSSKQVLLPGSPPELAYAAPPQAQPIYYEARAGVPFHKGAIGTETKKTVRMDESTENSRRIVTVEQTSRVIKLPDKTGQYVPTPKKFVRSQTRESDYESDVDSVRIKPKWTPTDSDTEDPRYRRVQPPTCTPKKGTEYSGVPVTSPFDSDGSQFLRPGSPPEFGFVSRPADVKKAANHVASRHMSDMTSAFKSKTEKFVSDIQSDLKQGKPILKHPVDAHSDGEEDTPRTYREESRVAEHGTKQIDPDTGLIYFKYDFGYEFGIVLPGEGKKTVTSTSKSIRGQRRASDIEVPIVHEFTQAKENGFSASSQGKKSTTSYSPGTAKYGPSKTVKWEPTSESEFSESEDVRSGRRRYPGGQVSGTNVNTSCAAAAPPPSLLIPCSPSPSRWDHTTPSPLSLSPSLPSLSPRYSSATGPPSNVDSAGSPWPTTNGVTSNKEVIQPYLEILPKKAPLFITPLRDIAVVSGQTARFECIVQAEPQPNILWSKDGRIIENSSNYELHYRNGVCRLTISHAFPDDAGTYACTATNSLGSTVTSATLQVPGTTLR